MPTRESQQQFKPEEFRQLHEHIRTFETALATVFTVSLVACTTLLTGVSAWFFETFRTDSKKITTALCYLFLSPAFLSVVTLALISSYKTAIYRNGYYIKIFLEEMDEGARWHVNLVAYRALKRGLLRRIVGEHGDPAPLMLWALLAISTGLFLYGLGSIDHLQRRDFVAPAVLWLTMIFCQLAFLSDRKRIEKDWSEVRGPRPAAPCPETQSEKCVPPALPEQGGHEDGGAR